VNDGLDHPERVQTPTEPAPRRSARDHVLATIVAVVIAAAVVVVAILSFDLNPAGPVIVVVAAIVGGSLGVRRVPEPALKGAAVGLVIGGIAAILFWPFFDVS
jgi:hypothetical protein